MKEFNLTGYPIRINTKAIAEGLLKIHNQNENMKTMLSFGMLDANIMDEAEKAIREGITNGIDPLDIELFRDKINIFINETMKEISVIIYQNAKMIV